MKAKYDSIGKTYNQTRKADPFITETLLKHLSPNKDSLYLDIGCGSGNYTNEFQKKGFKLIGIDPSSEMLKKAKLQNPNIDWKLGSVEDLELGDLKIDGIIATLTIHHWEDLIKGMRKLSNVLNTNGKLVLFTATPEQMKGYWLMEYFPQIILNSIAQMPSLSVISEALQVSDISIIQSEEYFIKPDLKDLFLYCGKHNPELYFNSKVLAGISSFASLSNQSEVTEGLAKLRKDINSGNIERIMASYENDLGDYLFIKARKN